jgi:hypothetical protein
MDLSEYISISGQGGLFKVIAKSTNGLIVESLEDSKRIHVHATQKVSALQDISIFTKNDDMPLGDVFQKIFDKENGGAAIGHKADGKELKKYFEDVLPEYDEDRVYVSDMKKVFQWYNILQSKGLLKPSDNSSEETGDASGAGEEKAAKAKSEKTKDEAGAAKAAAKKPAKAASKPKESAPKVSKAKTGKTTTVRKTGA